VRSAVIRLVKATADPKYPHEQGEPFETCLALRSKLIDALNLKIVLSHKELVAVMDDLKNAWDNVLMERSRALGARITEAWVRSSEEHDDFVLYLDYLKSMGIAQIELDVIYVETIQSAFNGESNE